MMFIFSAFSAVHLKNKANLFDPANRAGANLLKPFSHSGNLLRYA
jgi:hypothetical protein